MNKLFLFSAMLFFACANVPAQVTIGGLKEPAAGILLDLNSTAKGGLLLSNVTITSPDSIPFGSSVFQGITVATADVNMALRGTMVYNNGQGTTVPAGIYVWNGWSWTEDGRLNPAFLPHGSGAFTGKNHFDLALGNDGVNSCGSVSARQSQKTNFADRTQQDGATAPYSGVQVYTFTPKAGEKVSHVRFVYVETSGVSIDSIAPALPDYATANDIDYACKLTVYYRAALNRELQGTTRNTGNKLKLYAIYNSDASYSTPVKDQALGLSVSLQDCGTCGAYTDAEHTQWLNFMCHNLGADEDADPFTPAAAIHGAKYKWGVKTPVLTQKEDQNHTGSFTNWDSKGETPPTSENDWDMTTANPCPAGWRVPTRTEWENVLANNSQIRAGNWENKSDNFYGYLKIGDALILPTAGWRRDIDGVLAYRGESAYYWSSTGAANMTGYTLIENKSNSYSIVYNLSRSYGYSVRCVAD